jgi:hypothetical protein
MSKEELRANAGEYVFSIIPLVSAEAMLGGRR